jgi:hypothetical protein
MIPDPALELAHHPGRVGKSAALGRLAEDGLAVGRQVQHGRNL